MKTFSLSLEILRFDHTCDKWLPDLSYFTVRATEIVLRGPMTDKAIELDEHRGMAAQKATDLRRLLADVEANEAALRLRQDELEAHLIAAPAANWHEAAEKARYLLNLFAATPYAQDPRRQTLIAAVLADFQRLSAEL